MRRVKIFVCLVLATGCFSVALATAARVIILGRSDQYYMDETSIYRNPANINIYPNMLLGDLGRFEKDSAIDHPGIERGYEKLYSYNRDPIRPNFGGILSYSLNQSTDAGEQYPMLSVGAVFNRYDDMLIYLDPKNGGIDSIFAGIPASFVMKDPVGKIDVIGGVALPGGGMIGAGGYFAFQEVNQPGSVDDPEYETKLFQGNVGVNWPVAKTMDLEISAGVSRLTGVGQVVSVGHPDSTVKIADDNLAFRGNVRLFSALTLLNGDFVPQIGVKVIDLNGDREIVDVQGGIGLNLNIDRGFFWTGLTGIYKEINRPDENAQELGGKVSFGLERNIVWDWLVWRIGGTKKIAYQIGKGNSGRWVENNEADASDEDLIGFGMGINIENRLRIDAVMAEDIFYTFTNLFAGNHHHLFTLFSATYSF